MRCARGEGAVVSVIKNKVIVESKSNNRWEIPKESITLLGARYQVYSQEGVTYPIGLPYHPSGMGRAIFYDLSYNETRILSDLECWEISGGEKEHFL